MVQEKEILIIHNIKHGIDVKKSTVLYSVSEIACG